MLVKYHYVLNYTEILTLSATANTVSSTIILIMERLAKLTFIYYIDFCFKGGQLECNKLFSKYFALFIGNTAR